MGNYVAAADSNTGAERNLPITLLSSIQSASCQRQMKNWSPIINRELRRAFLSISLLLFLLFNNNNNISDHISRSRLARFSQIICRRSLNVCFLKNKHTTPADD